KGHFVGLPIPAAAQMITSTVVLYYFLGGEGSPSRHLTLLLVIYGLAVLMVSNVPYFSLKNTDLKKRHPVWMLVSGVSWIAHLGAERHLMLWISVLLHTYLGRLLGGLGTWKGRRAR